MEPREIRPTLPSWTAAHPKIHARACSDWSAPVPVSLDPPPQAGGLDALPALGPPDHVTLTNRYDWRCCSEIVEAFDCPVWCNELGLDEFDQLDDETGSDGVRGLWAGDTLPGEVEWETLLLAHGLPLSGNAHGELRTHAEG